MAVVSTMPDMWGSMMSSTTTSTNGSRGRISSRTSRCWSHALTGTRPLRRRQPFSGVLNSTSTSSTRQTMYPGQTILRRKR